MYTSTSVLTVKRAGRAYIPVQGSSQSKEQEACIPIQGSSQSEEHETCISAQVDDQDKIIVETDASLQEDPELKGVVHEVELNKCTTRGEITKGGQSQKHIWESSLKLMCGCLHRVW